MRFLNRDDAYNDAIRSSRSARDVASKDSFPRSFIVKAEQSRAAQGFRRAAMVSQPGVLSVAQPEGS